MGHLCNLDLPVIPISGWLGDNLVTRSTNMPWWTGHMSTKGTPVFKLREALDGLAEIPHATELNLRIPILNVVNVSRIGAVISRRIVSGILRKGRGAGDAAEADW